MKYVFENAIRMIRIMEHEQLPVREFIAAYSTNFEPVNLQNLIPPECRKHDNFAESVHIFVSGSYLYQMIEGKPVTWLERRRFAKYPHFTELFCRTLCSNPKRRFQSLNELRIYVHRLYARLFGKIL